MSRTAFGVFGNVSGAAMNSTKFQSRSKSMCSTSLGSLLTVETSFYLLVNRPCQMPRARWAPHRNPIGSRCPRSSRIRAWFGLLFDVGLIVLCPPSFPHAYTAQNRKVCPPPARNFSECKWCAMSFLRVPLRRAELWFGFDVVELCCRRHANPCNTLLREAE